MFSGRRPLPHVSPARLHLGVQTLGREGSIRIEDAAVSRRHAEIVHDGIVPKIVDLSSRNGIFVNGERVAHKPLSAGDVLRVGRTLWVVDSGQAHADHREAGRAAALGTLPVIVTGETGTGKEVLARLIHGESGRQGRFVAVDCASLPAALAEAELFGHRRGAFSGASASREGLFRHAHLGTILLDEIADLSPELQAKLLRVLESRHVRPLGAEDEVSVDVRVIAASPVDLRALVASGRFRRDLYGRLAGRTIRLLALRHRREALLELLVELGREERAEFDMTAEAAELLLLHSWPQNVRELRMFVRRAVEDLPAEVAPGGGGGASIDTTVHRGNLRRWRRRGGAPPGEIRRGPTPSSVQGSSFRRPLDHRRQRDGGRAPSRTQAGAGASVEEKRRPFVTYRGRTTQDALAS